MCRPFLKMQAAGNDFVLFDCLQEREADWSLLAPRVCDRHHGVGSDGLLVVLREGEAGFRMRMFNPDGTEDFCGNGLRCVARYLQATGKHTGSPLSLETIRGARTCRFLTSGMDSVVEVQMGRPRWEAAAIPAEAPWDPLAGVPLWVLGHQFTVTALSTGTAHTVIFCEALPEDNLFHTVSPVIENHKWFPERTSVLWCVVDSATKLHLRIWERGVGETLACGSGVCAAAAAAVRHGYAERSDISVVCPGGTLGVRWEGEEQWLRGPAEFVYEGELADSWPDSVPKAR